MMIALSTCLAKYIATSNTLRKTTRLLSILHNVDQTLHADPSPLFTDNQAAIRVAEIRYETKLRKSIDL